MSEKADNQASIDLPSSAEAAAADAVRDYLAVVGGDVGDAAAAAGQPDNSDDPADVLYALPRSRRVELDRFDEDGGYGGFGFAGGADLGLNLDLFRHVGSSSSPFDGPLGDPMARAQPPAADFGFATEPQVAELKALIDALPPSWDLAIGSTTTAVPTAPASLPQVPSAFDSTPTSDAIMLGALAVSTTVLSLPAMFDQPQLTGDAFVDQITSDLAQERAEDVAENPTIGVRADREPDELDPALRGDDLLIGEEDSGDGVQQLGAIATGAPTGAIASLEEIQKTQAAQAATVSVSDVVAAAPEPSVAPPTSTVELAPTAPDVPASGGGLITTEDNTPEPDGTTVFEPPVPLGGVGDDAAVDDDTGDVTVVSDETTDEDTPPAEASTADDMSTTSAASELDTRTADNVSDAASATEIEDGAIPDIAVDDRAPVTPASDVAYPDAGAGVPPEIAHAVLDALDAATADAAANPAQLDDDPDLFEPPADQVASTMPAPLVDDGLVDPADDVDEASDPFDDGSGM